MKGLAIEEVLSRVVVALGICILLKNTFFPEVSEDFPRSFLFFLRVSLKDKNLRYV